MKPAHSIYVLIGACLINGCAAGPDAKPTLPTGRVDLPQVNQIVKDRLAAYGWALSEDRIKRVSAYVDRIYVKDCTIGIARPDVKQSFPSFPNSDRAGWTVDLDFSSLPEGKHEMVFQAESEKGAIRDLGVIPIIIDH